MGNFSKIGLAISCANTATRKSVANFLNGTYYASAGNAVECAEQMLEGHKGYAEELSKMVGVRDDNVSIFYVNVIEDVVVDCFAKANEAGKQGYGTALNGL